MFVQSLALCQLLRHRSGVSNLLMMRAAYGHDVLEQPLVLKQALMDFFASTSVISSMKYPIKTLARIAWNIDKCFCGFVCVFAARRPR
eukprot:COSAG05_NODE_1607_length_4414_cov_2.784241_6_plen_88_part_00